MIDYFCDGKIVLKKLLKKVKSFRENVVKMLKKGKEIDVVIFIQIQIKFSKSLSVVKFCTLNVVL